MRKDTWTMSFTRRHKRLALMRRSVELVKTNCDLPGFSEYLGLKDRRIVICINGVFFYFEPAVNY